MKIISILFSCLLSTSSFPADRVSKFEVIRDIGKAMKTSGLPEDAVFTPTNIQILDQGVFIVGHASAKDFLRLAVCHYSADGKLQESFGNKGCYVHLDPDQEIRSVGDAVTNHKEGFLVSGGVSKQKDGGFVFLKLDKSGAPDNLYGSNEPILIILAPDAPLDMKLANEVHTPANRHFWVFIASDTKEGIHAITHAGLPERYLVNISLNSKLEARVSGLADESWKKDNESPVHGVLGDPTEKFGKELSATGNVISGTSSELNGVDLTYVVVEKDGRYTVSFKKFISNADQVAKKRSPKDEELDDALTYKMTAEEMKKLLADGASPNGVSHTGDTFLARAIGQDKDVLKLLLAAGANPSARGRYGTTPLMAAIDGGKSEVIPFLIENGASVKGDEGLEALFTAIIKEDPEAIEALVRAGVSPNGKLSRLPSDDPRFTFRSIDSMALDRAEEIGVGATPMMLAMRSFANAKTISKLLQLGADPNKPDTEGDLPLFKVVRTGNGSTDEWAALIKGGADISATDADGNTTLSEAAFYGATTAIRYYIKKGVDKNKANHSGTTPELALRRKIAHYGLNEKADGRYFEALKLLNGEIPVETPLSGKLIHDEYSKSRFEFDVKIDGGFAPYEVSVEDESKASVESEYGDVVTFKEDGVPVTVTDMIGQQFVIEAPTIKDE